ncbi:MAG: polymer-forming cytoskeletal protein [Chloroflexi bacterium]|nr:polymer-forming cytoskeletal protein [Chloroflexota bacterium]
MNKVLLHKKVVMVALLTLFLFGFVPTTFAFTGQEGDQVVIKADEVIEDDLYVAAETFILDGTVQGDLFVAGSTIMINGTVEGDLFAFGQVVNINGSVGDDVRTGAMAVELGESAVIGGDLLAGGYSLFAQNGSSVDHDLLFGGFQALLEGEVGRDALIGGNSVKLDGRIQGDVRAAVDGDPNAPVVNPNTFASDGPDMPSVPVGLTISDDAQIDGELHYEARETVVIPEGIVGGEVDFEHVVFSSNSDVQATTPENPVWQHVRRFVVLALIGALLVWKMPTFINRLSDNLEQEPLPSLGWGTAVYFGFPFAVFVLMVTAIVLAIMFGTIGLGNLGGTLILLTLAILFALMVCFVMVLLYLTKIIVGYLAGRMILTRINPTWGENRYYSLLLGLLLVVIVIAIPWLGGLTNWLIALIGCGAIWLMWREGQIPKEKAVLQTAE